MTEEVTASEEAEGEKEQELEGVSLVSSFWVLLSVWSRRKVSVVVMMV